MLVFNIFIGNAYAAVDAVAFGKVLDPIISQIVNPIVLFAFGIGVFVFVWGVIELIRNADDPAARTTGRNHILFGAIGMVIMFSAWGIIYLISNTLKEVNTTATSSNTINPAP